MDYSISKSGFKRKKFDEETDHLIPSTLEIHKLIKKAKEGHKRQRALAATIDDEVEIIKDDHDV